MHDGGPPQIQASGHQDGCKNALHEIDPIPLLDLLSHNLLGSLGTELSHIAHHRAGPISVELDRSGDIGFGKHQRHRLDGPFRNVHEFDAVLATFHADVRVGDLPFDARTPLDGDRAIRGIQVAFEMAFKNYVLAHELAAN